MLTFSVSTSSRSHDCSTRFARSARSLVWRQPRFYTDAAVSRRQTPSPYCTAPLLAATPRPPLRPVRAQSARRWWRCLLTLHAPSPLDAGTGWRYATSVLLACFIVTSAQLNGVNMAIQILHCTAYLICFVNVHDKITMSINCIYALQYDILINFHS